jgi:hypothetical protein
VRHDERLVFRELGRDGGFFPGNVFARAEKLDVARTDVGDLENVPLAVWNEILRKDILKLIKNNCFC